MSLHYSRQEVMEEWTCRRKVRYSDAHGAAAAAMVLNERQPRDPRPLEPYSCQHCRGWHVGHSARRKRGTNA